jgi:hypothetical protein
VGVLCAVALALPAGVALDTATAAPSARPGDDAVVIAVLDSGISPYHHDFLASQMPQAKTPSRADDLPLHKPPHTWLKGFPKPSAFDEYAPLKLSLTDDPDAKMAELQEKDADAWSEVTESSAEEKSYRWVPGTKVVGAMSFGSSSASEPRLFGSGGDEHGQGVSSVSVGNIHGTCPECLLVFLQTPDPTSYEAAISWAQKQKWIDAISVSLGFNTSLVLRDRVYEGSDVELSRAAVERGQTSFFSGGNGIENAFLAPQTTLLNSQNGPDWAVTVGAVDSSGANLTGNGKPVDVAGIGTDYPSSYGATTTSNGEDFSGTSNATPTLAGTYGRALWKARAALSGPSRVQAKGVVAQGGGVRCGPARKACELADGRLTQAELQRRLFTGATPSTVGTTPLAVVGAPATRVAVPHVFDERFASEGHGVWAGRLKEDGLAATDARLWDVLRGARPEAERPEGETEWFRVDSWCRQGRWGSWKQGNYRDEATTPLPGRDAAWPLRSALLSACPALAR